ncbi:MAG: nucleoside-diphosphate kinase [Acidimicrobiales bacterium]
MERTLVIIKPDAVERGLVGEILGRLEAKGMRFVAAELRQMPLEVAERHYEEHHGKPFFPELLEFITRSPSLVAVVEGPEGTHATVRTMMGATDPKKAALGTIRGDLGTELPDNLVHGSDSPEAAAREIALFFPDLA